MASADSRPGRRSSSKGKRNGHINGHSSGNGSSNGGANGEGAMTAPVNNGPASARRRRTSSSRPAAEAQSAAAAAAPAGKRGRGWKWDVAALLVLMVVCGAALVSFLVWWVLAEMPHDDWLALRVPTSLVAAQHSGEVLSRYTQAQYERVLLGHAATYVYLQTFAIPGTVFVNLLAGALFGMWVGFPLCLLYNTVGSIFLYALSSLFGRRLVARFFPKKLGQFRDLLAEHVGGVTLAVANDELSPVAEAAAAAGAGAATSSEPKSGKPGKPESLLDTLRGGLPLMGYMTFLRIFPFTPNWFMNVASPLLGIPVWQFAPAVAVGLTPYNFLSCQAGLVLSMLRSKNDIMDPRVTGVLAAIAVAGMVTPTIVKRTCAKKKGGMLPPLSPRRSPATHNAADALELAKKTL